MRAIEAAGGRPITSLKADGGATTNGWLMQFQADILNTVVERPKITETTIMGAAYLAGICVGLWQQNELTIHREIDVEFIPKFT